LLPLSVCGALALATHVSFVEEMRGDNARGSEGFARDAAFS
jgi:hypothetical protein